MWLSHTIASGWHLLTDKSGTFSSVAVHCFIRLFVCLFVVDVGSVEGLAYHRAWDTLYWTSSTSSTISRKTVDPKRADAFSRQAVVTLSEEDHPHVLALDECQKSVILCFVFFLLLLSGFFLSVCLMFFLLVLHYQLNHDDAFALFSASERWWRDAGFFVPTADYCQCMSCHEQNCHFRS